MKSKSNRFRYWTQKTAFCFERKMRCLGCTEYPFCEREPFNNDFGMPARKYAALQTFAQIGLYGFEDAIKKIGQKKNIMKDIEL